MRLLLMSCIGFALSVPSLAHAEPVNVLCSGSALKKDCRAPANSPDQQEQVRKLKLKPIQLQRTLKIPGRSATGDDHCVADIGLSFVQMNDQIRVDTKIANKDCGASQGMFDLRIRTVRESADGSRVSITRTISETWRRKDKGDVEMTTYYPMEDANYIGWVRVRNDMARACVCVDKLEDIASSLTKTQP